MWIMKSAQFKVYRGSDVIEINQTTTTTIGDMVVHQSSYFGMWKYSSLMVVIDVLLLLLS
jgi:hypothetical protein